MLPPAFVSVDGRLEYLLWSKVAVQALPTASKVVNSWHGSCEFEATQQLVI